MATAPVFDKPLQYPTAHRDESVVDDYHGVMVPDPYRWLENPDSLETKEFVECQIKLTDDVLRSCETRERLREKLTRLYDFPKHGAPFRAGDKYFYFHNTGLQPQRVLYMQDNLDSKAEVLLDPNTFSDDGTVALKGLIQVSEDAKYLAYGVSASGSDWVTVKVMRIEDKSVLPDTLSWVKFSYISWTHDSKGFFYSRFPPPEGAESLDAGTEVHSNQLHQLYYHFLGTDQSEDILCWSDPDHPKHVHLASVTEDGKYLLLYTHASTDRINKIYYCNISGLSNLLESYKGGSLPFIRLVDTFDASYEYIANDDTVFTFLTNKDAPRKKLVRVDVNGPSSWIDVVEEDKRDVLENAIAVNGNQILLNYLSDVKNVLQLRELETGAFLYRLPLDIGTVSNVSSRRKDKTIFIEFTSFLTPQIIFLCNLEAQVPEMNVFRETVVPNFDRTSFEVKQVFLPSKDGTKVPMFIVARKDICMDGSHPCLLYGYGGYGFNITPSFNIGHILIAKHLDVVFCVANIRGGGEYGKEWHKDGALSRKQNCFDDFISAAEYLVSAGYTQPSKLCIEGASNGGLLVMACVNQRPDLFGCALSHVGVMDMLRFHKFTIGYLSISEYGCSDKEDEFHWLIKYSPLHNVRRPWDNPCCKATQYPSTMLLTADHDDRVVPLHSLKLLATMQHVLCTSVEKSPQTNPIIGRIEHKAGHGCGKPTQKKIDEVADSYGFMAEVVGASWIE